MREACSRVFVCACVFQMFKSVEMKMKRIKCILIEHKHCVIAVVVISQPDAIENEKNRTLTKVEAMPQMTKSMAMISLIYFLSCFRFVLSYFYFSRVSTLFNELERHNEPNPFSTTLNSHYVVSRYSIFLQ